MPSKNPEPEEGRDSQCREDQAQAPENDRAKPEFKKKRGANERLLRLLGIVDDRNLLPYFIRWRGRIDRSGKLSLFPRSCGKCYCRSPHESRSAVIVCRSFFNQAYDGPGNCG